MWEALLLYPAAPLCPRAREWPPVQPCVMALPPALLLLAIPRAAMASGRDSDSELPVPEDKEDEEEEEGPDVKAVQAHYLRSPSPSR